MRGLLSGFAAAWIFLTRIPLPKLDLGEKDFSAAPGFYPLVGLLIGALGAAGYTLGWWIGGNWIAALFAIVTTLMATGAFHEDGLADVFDGLGAYDVERMMAIMRDSRLGTFGAAALFSVLMLKASALAALPFAWVLAALPVAHAVSRLSAVIVIATSRYVRAEGIAKPVAEGIAKGPLALALATGLLAIGMFALMAPPGAVLAAVVGLAIGHIAMRCVFERKLGGYTGDCLGAVQQVSELGFYLGALAWL